MKILIDTNVIIDFLRGNPDTVSALEKLSFERAAFCICDIIVAEVVAGMRTEEKEEVYSLLESMDFIPIGFEIAALGGMIRNTLLKKGITINVADALIAAVARENRLTLVTKNRKDFEPIEQLEISNIFL